MPGYNGQTTSTSQTREAGRGAAAVVGSAAVFHPSRPSFLRALIRGGVSSYHSPLIIGKRHRVKLKEELGDDQRRGEESGLVLARNARNASCMSHPRSRSALRGTSSLPSNPFALSHTLENPFLQFELLADMAGVEQLAGLVARLEAVAVKLESSGGAGGAGGDAGASVQVRDLFPSNSYEICFQAKIPSKRSLMTSVVRASSSLPTFVTRSGVMWQQSAKCCG